MSVAEHVLKQSRAIVVLVAMLVVAGVLAATRVPVSIFPQTDFPRVVILVEDGVVPAPQMLVSVTRPIEESLSGMPGIARIRSTTSPGASEISVFFEWGTEMPPALLLVQARLSQLSATLPPTAAIRRVERLTFAVFPVAGYSVQSPQRDGETLRDLAQFVIRPRLARLPGIANVLVAGGQVREHHVTVHLDRLVAHGITLQQVVDAVHNANIIASPGMLDENHQLQLALVSGRATSGEDLGRIVVATAHGAPVRISDIASVEWGHAPHYTLVTADGRPSVLLNVLRQPEANTLSVVQEVAREFKAMNQELPRDVRIGTYYDQSVLVRDSVTSVRDSILLGLLLSAAILFGFLRNWRATWIAVVVIPVTVLAAVLLMAMVGLGFDLMTLGGIAAAIGLVVDDAIVVVEDVHSHMNAGASVDEAVRRTLAEITTPIVGSTLTPVVVFVPLAFLAGVTGVFFRAMALTMTVALVTSLALALTFTPVLCRRLLARPEHARSTAAPGRVLAMLLGPYERALSFALRQPAGVLGICLVAAAGSFAMYQRLPSEFLPALDEGGIVLDYVAPPGTSLVETNRMLMHVEDALRDTGEIESFSRRTGLRLALAITEPNTGDFLIKLKAGRARSTAEVIDGLRAQIASFEPTLRVEFAGILGDLIGDLVSAPQPVEIKLFSEDAAAAERAASDVVRVVQEVPGIVDAFNGIVVSGPVATFRVDPARAASYGVTASDVASTMQTAMTGEVASAIMQHDRLIAVRVVADSEARQSLDTLRALNLRSPTTGALLRVADVADVEMDPGQTEIHRDGLRQVVSVTARLSGTDLGSAMREIRHRLETRAKLPAGVTVEFGGLYEQQQRSFGELALALLMAVVLVFLALLVEFRSFAHPVAILAGAILALCGVILALFVTGTSLNVVSFMGMIMVVGIVSKNGILMLDAIEGHLAAGMPLHQALVLSGRRRFRPVLMTSLAAILGMLPLAVALGAGAEMLQPLGVSVIGGLAFALLLSLVVTPTVFAQLRGRGKA